MPRNSKESQDDAHDIIVTSKKLNTNYVAEKIINTQESVRFPLRFRKGSLTVEAALILPLFLLVIAPVLKLFSFLEFQAEAFTALQATGRQLSGYYYAAEQLGSGEDDREEEKKELETIIGLGISLVASETVVRSTVLEKIPEDGDFYRDVRGGRDGIHFAGSRYDAEGERIVLEMWYEIRLPLLGETFLPAIHSLQKTSHRVWTGRDLPEKTEEEYVYVTETGKVYHTHLSCGSLSLRVNTVTPEALKTARNEAGEIYRACEICNATASGTLYISVYGNRFHSDRQCAGLKRTILTIPRSEIGDRALCKRCAAKGGS